MGWIYYGVKKATIGLDELMRHCPSCEADSFADVMISSNYFHIYFVPLFPFEKEASCICQQCGLKSYDVPFNERTFKDYNEIKNRYRHPWYTYFFVGLMGLTISLGIILSI